jgi:hypothetical protein
MNAKERTLGDDLRKEIALETLEKRGKTPPFLLQALSLV